VEGAHLDLDSGALTPLSGGPATDTLAGAPPTAGHFAVYDASHQQVIGIEINDDALAMYGTAGAPPPASSTA
jgi:hypothetical protein